MAALPRHAVVLVLALAGRALADDAACVAACQAGPPESAPVCGELNTCADDDQACRDRIMACKDSLPGYEAASWAHRMCGDQPDAACCKEFCFRAQHPAEETSSTWVLVDALAGIGGRDAPSSGGLAGSIGAVGELLFGARHFRDGHVGLRGGPFASVTGVFAPGGANLELAGGGSLLLGVHRFQYSKLASAWEISGGVVADFAKREDVATGGLARVSFGMLPTGPNAWKPVTAWLYVEGDFFADRRQVFIGARIAPLDFPLILVPFDDY